MVIGEASPSANPKDEEVIAIELAEKALPGGTFSKPVAGHLYFRVRNEILKDRKARFELTYEISGRQGMLALKR